MNPYDPGAAFEAIRPRLASARARRRRAVATGAALGLLAVSSVATAAVMLPSDDGAQQIATSPEDRAPDGGATTSTTAEPPTIPVPASTADTTTTPTPSTAPADVVDDPAGAQAPAPPSTEVPEPTTTTTTATPPTKEAAAKPTTSRPSGGSIQTLQFTYPGTGSVTVTQQGSALKLVAVSVIGDWTHASSHDHPDLVKAEFRRDGVERWLTVIVRDGVAAAEQHERSSCGPPAGTSTHQAPNGAGSMTVSVAGSGALSLVTATPAAGWSTEVLFDEPNLVKVGFRTGPDFVWVLVKVHDCALAVESG